jgi:hypothetical protein
MVDIYPQLLEGVGDLQPWVPYLLLGAPSSPQMLASEDQKVG